MLFLEVIESFLGSLDNEFGKFIISIGFVVFFAIALSFIGISKLLIFLIVLACLVMFVSFGWLPLWLIIALGMLIFAIGFVNIRGAING